MVINATCMFSFNYFTFKIFRIVHGDILDGIDVNRTLFFPRPLFTSSLKLTLPTEELTREVKATIRVLEAPEVMQEDIFETTIANHGKMNSTESKEQQYSIMKLTSQ